MNGRVPFSAHHDTSQCCYVSFHRLHRHLKLFAEFLNLTEEPLREYTGVRRRENDFEIYQWKARFGVNFNL